MLNVLDTATGLLRTWLHSTGGALHTLLQGSNDAGEPVPLNVDDKGHLEVALHDPRLPFGSVHTESLTPVFQVDAVYGINEFLNTVTTGHSTFGVTSASVTRTNNLFKCATGTTSSLNTREDH